MKSMTGYGWKEVSGESALISAELKSYNSRFLDLSVNLPYWLNRLENRAREFVSSRIQRGKVELTIRVREHSSNLQVYPDPEAAKAYMGAISSIAETLGHRGEIPLSLIVNQEGVLKSERSLDIDAYWLMIEPVLQSAYEAFESSREAEGKALSRDIKAQISRIEGTAELIASRVPEMEGLFRENITKRFQELLGNQVDEQRVMQETAALLVRYTINEELVRLRAHLASLRKELDENPAPGRKADFICQEINREVNTIGSKNQLLEIGQGVIDAKDALENIREQMRNIE